ncbi:MAG: cyclic nucleotide-binding domain-containing protein [Lachnospiraceae bacterium]|nr:cyclic nucleotide-binding domain-containing protein [Lachnospiraceae bacterium]
MQAAKILKYAPEDIVLKEGDVNADMYKIIQGHAELYVGYGTPYENLLGVIGKGSCFGEFGLLLKQPSIYTVIAYSDLAILRISDVDMGEFVQENHNYVIEIMRNMAKSMMTMKFQVDQLMKEVDSLKPEDHGQDLAERMRQARMTMRQYAVYNPIRNLGAEEENFLNKYV